MLAACGECIEHFLFTLGTFLLDLARYSMYDEIIDESQGVVVPGFEEPRSILSLKIDGHSLKVSNKALLLRDRRHMQYPPALESLFLCDDLEETEYLARAPTLMLGSSLTSIPRLA